MTSEAHAYKLAAMSIFEWYFPKQMESITTAIKESGFEYEGLKVVENEIFLFTLAHIDKQMQNNSKIDHELRIIVFNEIVDTYIRKQGIDNTYKYFDKVLDNRLEEYAKCLNKKNNIEVLIELFTQVIAKAIKTNFNELFIINETALELDFVKIINIKKSCLDNYKYLGGALHIIDNALEIVSESKDETSIFGNEALPALLFCNKYQILEDPYRRFINYPDESAHEIWETFLKQYGESSIKVSEIGRAHV